MSLEFKNFKKKLSKKNSLELNFFLEDNKNLSIIVDNSSSLIIEKVFANKEKYNGEIIFNKSNIKDIAKPLLIKDIGFYKNFSIYETLKNILSLYDIKFKKKVLLDNIEKLGFNSKTKYSDITDSEKEKLHIYFLTLISKDLLILNLADSALTSEDEQIVFDILKDKLANSSITFISISRSINLISDLCHDALVIADNKQSYYGSLSKLNIVKDLIIIELATENLERIVEEIDLDIKIIGNKLIIRKADLEKALYYFVKSDIRVVNIGDFNKNTSLYEVKE
ncbi:hypothetical protein HZY83_03825 [Gemella sp. GH3]|uniref:hypothetical protein n=1 Tax=unclassified Gemella TaxID=2624949 RepID=UPI0015D079F8|nr:MULTISPECIES: hypothetical protein [unclassified Gemella]MBF0713809.1 hypothetical protein [Gemella sp. GH3.1]NYS50761.1 hypothetical protein [Gemella sp. GH3]